MLDQLIHSLEGRGPGGDCVGDSAVGGYERGAVDANVEGGGGEDLLGGGR